ncbi:MAG: hypothetical protein MJ145_03780 [Clostridia bacterium]|nr:hypothetical protein [Clostridia bacterium]
MREYKYLRIQGRELAENTRWGKGVFSMLQQLITDGVMAQEDIDLHNELGAWFEENLPFPPQCRKQENVICYFKTENSKEMEKMIRPLIWLLEVYNHPYYVVYTNNPGEIVYEDEYQVAVKVEPPIVEDLQEPWCTEE